MSPLPCARTAKNSCVKNPHGDERARTKRDEADVIDRSNACYTGSASPTGPPGDDPLLDTAEANHYLRVRKGYLEKKRVFGGGPVFIRVGGGSRIVYRKSALDHWLSQFAARSTSEYTPASPADGNAA